MPRRRRPRLPDGAILAYRAAIRRALARAEDQIAAILEPKLAKLDARRDPVRYGLRAVEANVDPDEIRAVAGQTERANMRELRATLPRTLLARVPSGVSPKLIERFRRENVDLITSLVDGELEEITDLLDEGFKKGTRVEDLRKQIKERFDVSKSKADLLARDQVLKLNAKITQTRQKQAGIRSFTWSTSNDERVRPEHAELDGSVFAWSDLPTVDGEPDVMPGTQFQCRCVAIPIPPPLDDAPDDE